MTTTAPILATTPLASLRAFHPKAWQRIHPLMTHRKDRTLEQLATSQGLDLYKLLFDLNQLEGRLHQFLPCLPMQERIRLTGPTPADRESFQGLMQQWQTIPADKQVKIDTRPLLDQGIDPFNQIQASLASLPSQGMILLIIPFQPLPLYQVLAGLGYGYQAAYGEDNWHIGVFAKTAEQKAPPPPALLDVRDLPPPEPMVRVLQAVTGLQPGQSIQVIHHRLPHLLYPRLAERNLQVTTREEEDGSVLLTITRPQEG
ncbi:MAG: DUF2249 domain-containing protein [Magnetococcales bacterium]|nr:DUF2249 domain-containing protein [Magnetococcales bacterium]NGZ26427.1 DUF2249 domain-containing protein [Magnetococcales bacterium]